MAKIKIPSTQAMRYLKSKKIEFEPLFYKYIEHGGTKESSKQLGIKENRIIKTLIFEDDNKKPLIVLMNGDYDVSIKQLARIIKVKKVELADEARAQKYTGYRVGGTSPFGVRQKMRVYAQKDIFDYEKIVINGGQRGFLIEIQTKDLKELLDAEVVDAAIKPSAE